MLIMYQKVGKLQNLATSQELNKTEITESNSLVWAGCKKIGWKFLCDQSILPAHSDSHEEEKIRKLKISDFAKTNYNLVQGWGRLFKK